MRVLLIDDDFNLCRVLAHQLEKNGYQVTTANEGKRGIELFRKQSFEIVISDIQMPDINGIEVLKTIRDLNKEAIIILITAYGTVEDAIRACDLGADDFLTKPFGQEQLLFIIEKAVQIQQLHNENALLKQEVAGKYKFDNMVADSARMQEVLKLTIQVARSNATVLITGESGTGKELIARAIHYNSPRKEKPLITVNCPSIPENLIESELFGHVKGAFTGAIKDRKGQFEQADGGSIFLDEIGDLREDLQAKLLRVLQEHEFQPVGGSKTIKVDVRIIAATNRNLELLVKQKRFREDLYYRLSVVPIIIAPLRERKEDIPFLIDFFVKKYSEGRKFKVSSEAIKTLQNYEWPGNVRELENIIERILALATDSKITIANIPEYISGSFYEPSGTTINIPEEGIALDTVERMVIKEILQRTGGNRSKTARMLQIPRHVLLYRLKKFGLE
ncbi:MAG: sigma-54-dependent Fis family transcriptional regulator [Calditrichia bacterium]|nr:sigma-54-dependent Fis family transcriptional regulator [Calditrichia bacterium]